MAETTNVNSPASAGETILQSQGTAVSNDTTTSGNTSPIVFTQDQINQVLNTDVRTLVQTQSTPQLSLGLGNASSTIAATSPGVGAPSDDTGTAKNSTQTAVDLVFGSNKTTATPNPLDNYMSYTYNISVYLMTPEGYQQLTTTGKPNLGMSELLFQSGGAPPTGRNPYFKDDYYIDHLSIKSVLPGKGSSGANQTTEITMTVLEPNGLSLVWNLASAVKQVISASNSSGKSISWSAQMFLLGITFYGYDDSGTPSQCTRTTSSGQRIPIQKFYPFLIKEVKYKVGNKLVEYTITGTTTGTIIAGGSNRGSIPFNIEMTASTVGDILGVAPETQANVSVDGREASNTNTPQQAVSATSTAGTATQDPTQRLGLMTALNQWQQNLVKNGQYTYPDAYSIQFPSDVISNAKVLVKGGDYKGTGLPATETPANAVLPEKTSVDNNTRNLSFTAGQQITQLIEQVVRRSSYILDQSNTVVSERDGVQTPNPSSGKNMAWFKINMQAVPMQWDPKRNDYAYNIEYVVTPYKLNQIVSSYFNTPEPDDPHKAYYYWFTGQNTQVLSYEQEYNTLYTVAVTNNQAPQGAVAVNEAIKFQYFPRSGQTSQGAEGRSNEMTANAADYIYESTDLATATMTIVGDPDWLPQGESLAIPSSFTAASFLADGTINFDASQVLFQIIINAPFDYNMQTGLMDPLNPVSNGSPEATQSFVYAAIEVSSEFNKGKFTQVLKGNLNNFTPSQVQNQQAASLPSVITQTVSNARNANVFATQTNPIAENFPITNTSATSTPLPPGQIGTVIGNVLPLTSGNPNPVPTPSPLPPTSTGDIAPANSSPISMSVQEAAAIQATTPQLINREP
jgi:hypothetical protein